MDRPYPRWKRTVIAGQAIADDWCLHASEARSVARIYRETGGQNDGKWFWTVQVGADGRPFNGGAGYAATGTEARRLCEEKVPADMRPRGEAI